MHYTSNREIMIILLNIINFTKKKTMRIKKVIMENSFLVLLML